MNRSDVFSSAAALSDDNHLANNQVGMRYGHMPHLIFVIILNSSGCCIIYDLNASLSEVCSDAVAVSFADNCVGEQK